MKSKIAVLIPIHKELTSHTSDERALLEQQRRYSRTDPSSFLAPIP